MMSIVGSVMTVLLSAMVNILVLLFGWGLTPKSWAWIFGGVAWGLISIFMLSVSMAIEKELKKDKK